MEALKKFLQFTKELKEQNTNKHKIDTLIKYKDDQDVVTILKFVYNPYLVTGISTRKLFKSVTNGDILLDVYPNCELSFLELLEYLQNNNTGTDRDIAVVHRTYDQLIPEDYDPESLNLAELFNRIVTKDLPLGIDVATINKAIPKCIPEFKVQLANRYYDKPENLEGKSFSLTTKIDGGRIIALKENGVVSFYTRQGQPYEGLVDLEKEFSTFPDDTCLDGEITLLDPQGLSSGDQYKATMKITRADGEKHNIKMKVFDLLSAREFRQGICSKIYKKRRAELEQLFENKYTYFEVLPLLYNGKDTKVIEFWLDYCTSRGEEGVMINLDDAYYDYKRSWALQKVKRFQDIDLKVIGYEEGTNKYVGKLGALIVDLEGNEVKVGSGFSDELRDSIWSERDEWIGRTITIKFFEFTKNANGGKSMRFPIYVDYRLDK